MMLCRLQMTEAALALSEEKNRSMEELMAQAKAEAEEQTERQIRGRKKEQEVWNHGRKHCKIMGSRAPFSGQNTITDVYCETTA